MTDIIKAFVEADEVEIGEESDLVLVDDGEENEDYIKKQLEIFDLSWDIYAWFKCRYLSDHPKNV